MLGAARSEDITLGNANMTQRPIRAPLELATDVHESVGSYRTYTLRIQG